MVKFSFNCQMDGTFKIPLSSTIYVSYSIKVPLHSREDSMVRTFVTRASPRDQYDITSIHIGGVKIKKLKVNILVVY